MLLRICASVLLVFSLVEYAAAGAPKYQVTVIANPVGYKTVSAVKVNNSGNFIAGANSGTAIDWFFWSSASGYQKIAAPEGYSIQSAAGINDSNEIVLNATPGPFVWDPSGAVTIIPISNGYTSPVATGINAVGAVVGSVKSNITTLSFEWSPADGFSVLAPSRSTAAVAINDSAEVAATLLKANTRTDAARLDPSGRVWPTGFEPEGGRSVAVAINSSGTLALNYTFTSEPNAAIWSRPHGIMLLPPINSETIAIADSGEVLGLSNPGGTLPQGNFIWGKRFGVAMLADQLNKKVDDLVAFDMSRSTKIISAFGKVFGNASALLLVPTN
jgi:hypothetical protein